MILLIDNFDSFTCNIATALNQLNQEVFIKKNNELSLGEIERLSPKYIIIGPGPKAPKDAGISVELIKRYYKKIPLLGICLGHQAIFEAFGGEVIESSFPMHGKKEKIYVNAGKIFEGLSKDFDVIRYNSLTAKKSTLPNELKITAENINKEIMAIEHIKYPVFGVQFHPESFFSKHTLEIFSNFLKSHKNYSV